MTVDVKLMDTTNKSVIFEMRRSGMPMRKIGEKIGRSRERVRQILIKSLGTTNHEYLSTSQLCSQSGMSRNRIVDLYLDGIITPIARWDVGSRDYLLCPPEAVKKSVFIIKIVGFVNFVINRYLKIEYFSAPIIVVWNVKNTNI